MSTTTGAGPDDGNAMAKGFDPIAVVDPPQAAITGVVFVVASPSIPRSAISRAQ
jgi:hypothetical protein